MRDGWKGAKAAYLMVVGEKEAENSLTRRFSTPGVTHHDPARASSGYTLYTSTHAPEAILINMAGQVVHRWYVPFSRVLEATGQTDRTAEPDEEVEAREVRLLADGDLLVVYDRPHHTPYGRGLARFDSDGRVVWGLVEHLHHDVAVAADGRLYALAHEIRAEPRERLAGVKAPFFDEFLVVVSADGTILDRISIYEAFDRSPFRHAITRLADLDNPYGDYLHPNAVEIVTPEVAARVAGWKVGQALVSLREMDALALIDIGRREVVWLLRGQWHRQHDPDLLSNGRVIVFDNQGDFASGGSSRVVEVDPHSGGILWQFPSTPAATLYSDLRGGQQVLDNGNVLITESTAGRLLEVTRAGEIAWEFQNPVELDGYHASILTAHRVKANDLTFLD